MGVLGIVGQAAEGSNQSGYGRFEVKRNFQFAVDFFPAFESSAFSAFLTDDVRDSLKQAIKTINRPTREMGVITLDHGNEQWNIAGKTNHSADISTTFYDVIPVGNTGGDIAGDRNNQYSASAIFYDWMNLQQSITTGSAGFKRDYSANIVVTQFDPTGEAIERYVYHAAFPTSIGQVDLDYTSADGTNEITVSFKVDKIYRVRVDSNVPPSEVVGIIGEE